MNFKIIFLISNPLPVRKGCFNILDCGKDILAFATTVYGLDVGIFGGVSYSNRHYNKIII